MKCPHCKKDIKEELIVSEAARIYGRRSKRKLSSDEGRAMVQKRYDKQKKEGDE